MTERTRQAAESLAEWRRRRLELAGFDPPLAKDLAATPDVDLHEVLELVDRGCPPHLAAQIVAPL